MSAKSIQKPQGEITEGVSVPTSYCGIIMPIAAMGTYEKGHWERVRQIIDEAVRKAGYTPNMVSESADIGVIHSRIVQNIYNNPIVVCDVSGKNPNVMFELGMRLAFDKPVIIIKDDDTNYSFDTSPIEHLDYRRDLRYQDCLTFIERLTSRIIATVKKREDDPSSSPFLRHFGTFKVAELEQKTGSAEEVILSRLDEMQRSIGALASRPLVTAPALSAFTRGLKGIAETSKKRNKIDEDLLDSLAAKLLQKDSIQSVDDLVANIMNFFDNDELGMNELELRNHLILQVFPYLDKEQISKLK
ncbi:hypothetical protein [Brucella pituitosa]|uniref:hypothetical protein n=1 Tax=Brucella pituitosa TaxID=571256 RepID=UPI000C277B94|nr:hypothetical protein [Brucella pituitosa]PJO47200.1 hypothetical protein CWE02_19240 [Brucella pituitosa]